jgi:hypothetical protein
MKKICAVVTVAFASTGCVAATSEAPSDEPFASETQTSGDEGPDGWPDCGKGLITAELSFDPVGPGGSNFGGCPCLVDGVPAPSIMQRTNSNFPGYVYCAPPVYGCAEFWPVAWTPSIEGQYCMCAGIQLAATLQRTSPNFPGYLICTHAPNH